MKYKDTKTWIFFCTGLPVSPDFPDIAVMKKAVATLALVVTGMMCYAQNDTPPPPVPDMPMPPQQKINTDSVIFERVEIEASFPGGENAWREFLQTNLRPQTPVDFGAPAGTYTVIIQFVVDKEGKLSDFKALTKNGYGMENEVLRILKKSPVWQPANQDGRKVKAYRKQPVVFVVENAKKKKKNKDN